MRIKLDTYREDGVLHECFGIYNNRGDDWELLFSNATAEIHGVEFITSTAGKQPEILIVVQMRGTQYKQRGFFRVWREEPICRTIKIPLATVYWVSTRKRTCVLHAMTEQ